MGAILSYSLVSGLLLLTMYVAYRVLLAGENQHAYNRIILLMIYAVSFLALPVWSMVKHFLPASRPLIEVHQPMVLLAPITPVVPERHWWAVVLVLIFVAGMVVVGIRTLVSWIRICCIVARGKKQSREGYTLVVVDDPSIAPFSWMHYLVVNSDDIASASGPIISHEFCHIRCNHWLDLLIAQAVVVINWFNPAAWLMRAELMLIHEYQADLAVIDSGCDPRHYQLLLLKKAVGPRFPSLANSLNHSKLKKRITMMYQEKSGKSRRLKAIALVPACALAFSLSSIPAVKAAFSTIGETSVSIGKGTEKSVQGQTLSSELDPIKVVAYGTVKKNMSDSVDVRIKNINLNSESLSKDQVRIFIDGVEGSDEDLNNLDPKNIVDMTISKGDEPFILVRTRNSLAEIVTPDDLPVYKNGMEDLYRELAMAIRYPEEPARNGISGKAIVEFFVLSDGSIFGAHILQSSGNADLDAEAVRVVNCMRDGWRPGTVGGNPVNCVLSLPVEFHLKSE